MKLLLVVLATVALVGTVQGVMYVYNYTEFTEYSYGTGVSAVVMQCKGLQFQATMAYSLREISMYPSFHCAACCN